MVEEGMQRRFRPEIETYRTALESALREGKGKTTSTKARILIELRTTLGISEEEHNSITTELIKEYELPNSSTYRAAVEQALTDGIITPDEESLLGLLRESMDISMEEHNKIIEEVRNSMNIKEQESKQIEIEQEAQVDLTKPNEDDPMYWIQKGELVWASSGGKINEALTSLTHFDKAIEIDPLNYLAWANKGLVLKNLDRLDDALLCYNRALAINPNYVTVWYNKAVLLGSIGNFDEAIKAFDKALELNPNHEFAKRDREILMSIMVRRKQELQSVQTQNPLQ